MQKYKLEYGGMGESGFFDFYRREDVMALVKAVRDFITIDDEIHSTPSGENWPIIEERAERYTEARKNLLLFIKSIEKSG
uniref:Uncharacterized protein n=1 Tax=viral metagenome TaxID=1070528 RepID=A0A6M3M2V1_9ZZZZ